MKRALPVLLLVFAAMTAAGGDFLEMQLTHPRVQAARDQKDSVLRALCTSRGFAYPPREIFLRAFKREGVLEVWARDTSTVPFRLLTSYPVCERSGAPGPKRREGDRQVPEGFYHINVFNPVSDYHLSLGINYPNASDSIKGYRPALGGDIMIHGDCVTIGCIPIQNDPIRELYWLVVQVHAAGMERIPVHIFPSHMDSAGMTHLAALAAEDAGLLAFWLTLEPGYRHYQRTQMLPVVTVDGSGTYRVAGE